jgi:hypothetical protein
VDADLDIDTISCLPAAIFLPIPMNKKISFIFQAFDMGLIDNFNEVVHRGPKIVRDRAAAWNFVLT